MSASRTWPLGFLPAFLALACVAGRSLTKDGKPREKETTLWQKIKRPALPIPNVTPAVQQSVARESECVPEGAVMLSLTTTMVHGLRVRQFDIMRHRVRGF